MLKLIATDMDGTLVKSNKELPKEIFPIVDKLAEKNVKFVIASGRQYYNLKNHFNDNISDITYIAENGAVIYENGENIYADVMDEKILETLLEQIRKVDGAYPVFCGVNSAYIEDDNAEFLQHSHMYFERCIQISNLMDALKQDKICKIAIYDKKGAEHNVYPKIMSYCKSVKGVLSGENWMDITNVGINKGKAIEFLQKRHKISKAQCMAFGDYLNDLEMIEVCDYGFAMANGHPLLLENSNFIAEPNDDKGVITVIQAFLDGKLEEITKSIPIAENNGKSIDI